MAVKQKKHRAQHRVRKGRVELPLRAVVHAARESGITPLAYMLEVLNRPPLARRPKETVVRFAHRVDHDTAFRLTAARYAAPYIHARIATEVKINPPSPDANKPIDLTELSKSVAFLLTMSEHRKTIDVTPTSH